MAKEKKMKYRVVDYRGKDCVLETNSYTKAAKCAKDRSECCGDWYVEELDPDTGYYVMI